MLYLLLSAYPPPPPPPPPPPHLTPADGQMSRCVCNKPHAKTFAVYLCASYEQHTCLREHIIRYGFSPKRCPPVTLRAKRAVNWRDAVADKGCSVRAPVHLSIRERRALTSLTMSFYRITSPNHVVRRVKATRLYGRFGQRHVFFNIRQTTEHEVA